MGEGKKRQTYILEEQNIAKIKCIAYWQREEISAIVNDALDRYIAIYEIQNGEIKPPIKKAA